MGIKTSFKPISSKTNMHKSIRKDTISMHENQYFASNQPLIQKDQNYINNGRKSTSLYLIEQQSNKANLHIYDTESLKEVVKVLNTSKSLSFAVPVTRLPNDELLCFDLSQSTLKRAFIIDRNYKVRDLSPDIIYMHSSGIYFNNNIYCFGGWNNYNCDILAATNKFDLNKKRWIKLSPMPETDTYCQSVIFKGNILISGYINRNIWLYSIDIDSFSTIPYDFAYEKRKILVNAEKLYLIESNGGLIYESEDDYNWKSVSNSIFSDDLSIFQIYWSYNKGGIFIVINDFSNKNLYRCYYKFD